MSLDDFLDRGYRKAFGESREEAKRNRRCVVCKQPPVFYTAAGRQEYEISGVCEACFDKMFPPDEDE